ncbi:MAG: FAD-binding oxidoreductase [Rhizobiaceae bacterium]|nr:FAD-binding oxidoreductase [Rhizobiaceae bacterium]
MGGTRNRRIVVIGGGVAGLTAAIQLLEQDCDVVLLEKEELLGFHASGRSAALFSETYGNEIVRALSRGSRVDLQAGGFLSFTRGAVHVGFAGEEDRSAVDDLFKRLRVLEPDIIRLSADELTDIVPAIAPEHSCGGVFEPGAMDVDTDKILQTVAARLRKGGGTIVLGAEVLQIESIGAEMRVHTPRSVYRCDAVINASGAWADEIARRAGLSGLGLQPKRRTAFMFDAPGFETRNWPLVVDIGEQFYFKPDAGRLIGSLADATDTVPCDAYPDDIDIATAVYRIEEATRLRVSRPQTPWAGLRTFATDGSPVIGPDPRMPGFFWLAGQGGYGFQVSLIAARIAASMIARASADDLLDPLGVDHAAIAPDRFIQSAVASPENQPAFSQDNVHLLHNRGIAP